MAEGLSKRELERLGAYFNVDLGAGKLIKSRRYEEADGTPRMKALVDFGIAGVKKFDASLDEMDVAEGKVKPTLESLSIEQLEAIASEIGVSPEGRTSKVKLIVLIRKRLQEQGEVKAKAEAAEAEAKRKEAQRKAEAAIAEKERKAEDSKRSKLEGEKGESEEKESEAGKPDPAESS